MLPPRRSTLFALSATLTLCCLLGAHELSLLPDGRLHVHFLDVGQGDATLLVSPSGKQVLIDGGPDLSVLEHLGRHMPFFDRRIELLVLTHPDLDHLAGLPAIVERYSIGAVLLTGVRDGNARYQWLLHELEDRSVAILLADPAHDIAFDDGLLLDVLWPDTDLLGHAVPNKNDTSIVLRARFGSAAVLLPGDLESVGESGLLATGADVEATILKAGHHGSRTSSSTGFLLAVQPSLAVVSAGRENRFGHPHPDVLARFAAFGIPVRSTAEEGTVSLALGEPQRHPWYFRQRTFDIGR